MRLAGAGANRNSVDLSVRLHGVYSDFETLPGHEPVGESAAANCGKGTVVTYDRYHGAQGCYESAAGSMEWDVRLAAIMQPLHRALHTLRKRIRI